MTKMEKFLLQDAFLGALCVERIPVSIFLLNGIKIQGIIAAYDQFTVLLKRNASQLIYKNLIAAIVPARRVSVWKLQETGTSVNQLTESLALESDCP